MNAIKTSLAVAGLFLIGGIGATPASASVEMRNCVQRLAEIYSLPSHVGSDEVSVKLIAALCNVPSKEDTVYV